MTESDPQDELVARDLPQFLHVLEEMKQKVPAVTEHVQQLSERVLRPEASTESGISLLEVKQHLLLSSLINLTQLMLLKTEGQSVSGCPPVLRLVEIRTVLEKIRPLDQKLHYQVDKLIRSATTGVAASATDPLRFRANPGNMVSKLGGDEGDQSVESSGEGEEGGEAASKLYVPPRVVAMPYDEEGDGSSMVQEKRRRKVMKSSIVHELRSEYLDLPEEVHDVGRGLRSSRELKEERERETFEEANFMRLPSKRRTLGSGHGARETLDELVDLGALPSSSSLAGKKTRQGSVGRGKRKAARKGSKFKGRRRH